MPPPGLANCWRRLFFRSGKFSERAPVSADGARTLTIRHGSGGYAIVYRVLDREVIVTRIFHTREDR